MSIVELVGMVGAGKTTLADGLRTRWQQEGWVILSLDAAVSKCGRRLPVVGPLFRFSWSRRLLRFGVIALFAVTHVGFTVRALRSQLGLTISWRHRATILRLTLKAQSQCWFIQGRLRSRELVVLDEGPTHRAVNLFSWAEQVNPRAVSEYLRSVSGETVVILVAVPPAVARTRATGRGLPKRLDETNEAAVKAFLDRSEEVIEEVEAFLERSERIWVRADNDRPQELVIRELASRLELVLQRPPDAELRANAIQRIRIPKPDRPSMRTGFENPLAEKELASAVATAYRSNGAGALRFANRSGRSQTGVLDVDGGAKFVKVYKASVSTESIEREHAVLDHLAAKSFPAPRLTKSVDGRSYQSVGARHVAVFDLIEGRFHYHDYFWPFAPTDLFVGMSARTLAALHAALRDFPHQFTAADGFAGESAPRFRGAQWARETLEAAGGLQGDAVGSEVLSNKGAQSRALTRLAELEDHLGAAELTRGTIHGDYGPYNLLFGWGEPVVVVDFELARFDWLLTDVAKALPQFGSNRFGFRLDRMATFAAEYAAASHVDPAELTFLPAVWEFLTLRRAVVCWARSAGEEMGRWLDEASAKMKLASMISQRADSLASLLGR